MSYQDLIEVVGGHEELADLDPPERRLALRALIASMAGEPDPSRAGSLADWIDGFGPLTSLMSDPAVTDILINGPDETWVERDGRLEADGPLFRTRQELEHLIERLFGEAGVRIDSSVPIADARLHDGSRIHVVLPPLAPGGPLVSIRRFLNLTVTLDQLVERRFLSDDEADLLQDCVVQRRTVAIGGGTGAGKTTLANALLGCVPSDERVVIIEETRELRPGCAHWVSLVTRDDNIQGSGAIDQTELLRAALRMRPDRIVVGEVRGGEALVALHAMATGHEGSLVTVHARSAAEIPARLLDLALSHPDAPAEETLRRRLSDSLDLVVQVGRVEGRRCILEIRRP